MASLQPERIERARIPAATYRLQFNRHFTLRQATELVPYLRELGLSHVYASPLFKARPGSTHGYDVGDFHQLNPDLGSATDFATFVAALRQHGMGLVLDLVPNHMGIGGPENRWWWDVLTYGPASPYAGYFDIDWHPPDPRLRGKVLIPVLGDRFHRALEKGELRLAYEGGAFKLRYFEHQFPINPDSLPLARRNPADAESIDAALRHYNGHPDALDALIQEQCYRLTYWRHGDAELNYRRFFNITTLAGLRAEDEPVFIDSHRLVRQWLDQGMLDGLRVDHPDGLRDPEQYLHRLRALAPRAWIVVEKILEPGESLPSTWPVAGTTGYDFLNRVGGLFIDPAGEEPLTDFYAEFTGQPTDFAAIVREKKRWVLRELLVAEVNRLTQLLVQISAHHWRCRDFTSDELREALTELVAGFPVYRTYVCAEIGRLSAADMDAVNQAVQTARQHRPDLDSALFDFLGDLLQGRFPGEWEHEFTMRFQQLTGPAMAKGVEDTAYYCFNRLVCLNEVGGDPGQFGLAVEAFHRACAEALARWPHSLLATSTHDTKRSEDVRARLSLLSEIPERWIQAVRRWSALNERHRRGAFPDRNAEYLFYQTLVGAWPIDLPRALAFMGKAGCEAKQHTTWTQRNAAYERAMRDFVTGVLGDAEFIADLEQFVAPLTAPGHLNSLAQALIKLTAPGVPDLYQGTELWDLSLVDPDNRRPVDWGLRRRRLAELRALSIQTLWQRRAEGLPKLWLIRQALGLRRRRPELFNARSRYEPLSARGVKAQHLFAFIRGGSAITAVPRLVLGLRGDWAETTLELPAGAWHNELTGESLRGGALPLAGLFAKFPLALLSRKASSN